MNFFGPSWDDSNSSNCEAEEDRELQIGRLPDPRVEGRVKFERELEPKTIICLTRRSILTPEVMGNVD